MGYNALNYIITISISFIFGWVSSFLFQKYVSFELKIKKTKIKPKVFSDVRLQKIQSMLEEIRRNGEIPIKLPKAAEKSLKIIALTPNWENKIDEETIKTLNKIYNSWQMHLESEKKCKLRRGAKTGNLQGYKKPKWEGTYAEYEKAVEQGLITYDTEITIIDEDEDNSDYHGSWITLNEDGSVEEYME